MTLYAARRNASPRSVWSTFFGMRGSRPPRKSVHRQCPSRQAISTCGISGALPRLPRDRPVPRGIFPQLEPIAILHNACYIKADRSREHGRTRVESMSENWSLQHFYHTVINVRDLDESLAFYKLLGWEVLNDRRDVDWPDFVPTLFGMKRAKGRGVLMNLPADPDGPMLDLIQWLEPQAEF